MFDRPRPIRVDGDSQADPSRDRKGGGKSDRRYAGFRGSLRYELGPPSPSSRPRIPRVLRTDPRTLILDPPISSRSGRVGEQS